MNESSIVMPCNGGASAGGWSNATFFGSFGVADFDVRAAGAAAGAAPGAAPNAAHAFIQWSNPYFWSKAKPMNSQERLVQQAQKTKAANPKTNVWVC